MSNIVPSNGDQKVMQWLVMQTPRTVSSHIESLAKSKGLKIDVDFRYEYPDGKKSRKYAHSCRVVGNIQNALLVAREVEKLMEPADKKTLKKWLAMLDAVTVRQKATESTTDVALEVYAQKLSAYPADVAKSVLLDLTWNFFPTWAELKQEADAMVGERKMILTSLRKAKEPSKPTPKPEDNMTKKEKWESIDNILRNAGFSPKMEWKED